LNLAVAFEVLFAPHVQAETTHQISVNVAKFCSNDRASMETLYRQLREFYGLRSAIVHGGSADQDRLVDSTVAMFHVMSGILARILTEAELAHIFDEEQLRRKMLNEFMFGGAA